MTLKPQDSLAHYRLVEVLGQGGEPPRETRSGSARLTIVSTDEFGNKTTQVRLLR
jgi:hypothetical protein